MSEIYDVAIIGGGINGCGIARDLSGRGLKVLLMEKNDLASGTSSASSKIIHGGLRYLEYFHFRLVREALKEREVLLKMAPHLISPMRFVLPLSHLTRSKWLIRAGLLLYDYLSPRKILRKSKFLLLKDDVAGKDLKDEYKTAFEYSDCWVDDARLVVLNAISAKEKGATILTQTECKSCSVENKLWNLKIQTKTKKNLTQKAKVLINVSGPWLNIMKKNIALKQPNNKSSAKLIKGSHIIIKKIFNHNKAYLLQKEDNRVIFAFPYEKDFSLIGTTDLDYQGSLEKKITISPPEIDYLISVVNQYFNCELSNKDVINSFAGVRSLYDDGKSKPQDITRDYFLELLNNEAPLINIYGGKLTTFRKLAQGVAKKISPFFQNLPPDWTADSVLPGGFFDLEKNTSYRATKKLESEFVKKYHLNPKLARRYSESYGSLAHQFLKGVQKESDLGICFGADLYKKEVDYLLKNEWATSAQDILYRRSKLYLKLTAKEITKLENWVNKK